jgi:SPP1 gp7 family putative phage head morphogenesis protein
MTYKALEKAVGLNYKQLVLKEALNPTINALIIETATWVQRLRDQTLQNFSANSLRAMALGNTIDGVLKEFDLEKSKQKNAAKFVARNQIANFNGILTKIRHQKVGIEEGRWKTSGDEKVRPCHRDRDGKVFKLAEGCYSACDDKYLIPGSDFNCRCIYYAIIDEFKGI